MIQVSSKNDSYLSNVRRLPRRGKTLKLSLDYMRPVSATSLSREIEEEHDSRTLRFLGVFSRIQTCPDLDYETNRRC